MINAPAEAMIVTSEESGEVLGHNDDISENSAVRQARESNTVAVLCLQINPALAPTPSVNGDQRGNFDHSGVFLMYLKNVLYQVFLVKIS